MHKQTALCEDNRNLQQGKKDQKRQPREAGGLLPMLKTSGRRRCGFEPGEQLRTRAAWQSLPGSLNTGPIQHGQEEPEQESEEPATSSPPSHEGRSASSPLDDSRRARVKHRDEKFLFQGSLGELTTFTFQTGFVYRSRPQTEPAPRTPSPSSLTAASDTLPLW